MWYLVSSHSCTHTHTHIIVNISGRWSSFSDLSCRDGHDLSFKCQRLKPGSSFHLITKRIIDTHTHTHTVHWLSLSHSQSAWWSRTHYAFSFCGVPHFPNLSSSSGNPHTIQLHVFLHDLYPPVIRGIAVGKMNLCHIRDEQGAGEWNTRMEMIDTPERKSHQPVQEYFHSRCA